MLRLVKIINGRGNVGEVQKLPASAMENYTYGEALKLQGGTLTKCSPTDKPGYICAQDYQAPMENPGTVSAYPVSEQMLFETVITESPQSLKLGDKVTLSSGALSVTATTTGGVATVVDFLGALYAGETVLVKF